MGFVLSVINGMFPAVEAGLFLFLLHCLCHFTPSAKSCQQAVVLYMCSISASICTDGYTVCLIIETKNIMNNLCSVSEFFCNV